MRVYIYKGKKDETVPDSVEKLIIEEGVQVLPGHICYNYGLLTASGQDSRQLREVCLTNGLIEIGDSAFYACTKILEINVCGTVQLIGERAFQGCRGLRRVDFQTTLASSPHQLRGIYKRAFASCTFLQTIKLPPSVSTIGEGVFEGCCNALVEANLSSTCITEIPTSAFYACYSLQTVSLPNTLGWIGDDAFGNCRELVTVTLPLDSQPLRIGLDSFAYCRKLVNLVLPKGSTYQSNSFDGMKLMQDLHGSDATCVADGLMERFN